MRITENRILALVVCVICAFVSVFLIGGLKLKGEYSDVNDAFINGADAQHNIEYYLDRGAGYAADLAYESMQYLDDDTACEYVLSLSKALSGEEGVTDARYDNYVLLTDGVEKLYSEVQSAGHGDETAIEIAYYDYQGIGDLIKRDEYHACADDYAELISAFPANIISAIWGVDADISFGG